MSSDFDIKDFQKEVIDESNSNPVLVDFWADWCQPCKVLGPVLEELAEQNKGRFKLAKVNTEEFPSIAREYGIQSIPAVKLFMEGKVVAEFLGALPKSTIEKWLILNIPNEDQKELNEIKKQIQSEDTSNSIKRLEKLIKKAPELTEAKILLASHFVFSDPVKASKLIDNIGEDSPLYQTVTDIRTYNSFIQLESNKHEIEESKLKEKLFSAIGAAKKLDFKKTLEDLIFIIQVDKKYQNEIARKACVAFFHLLGNDHEITRLYRRQFDMALY